MKRRTSRNDEMEAEVAELVDADLAELIPKIRGQFQTFTNDDFADVRQEAATRFLNHLQHNPEDTRAFREDHNRRRAYLVGTLRNIAFDLHRKQAKEVAKIERYASHLGLDACETVAPSSGALEDARALAAKVLARMEEKARGSARCRVARFDALFALRSYLRGHPIQAADKPRFVRGFQFMAGVVREVLRSSFGDFAFDEFSDSLALLGADARTRTRALRGGKNSPEAMVDKAERCIHRQGLREFKRRLSTLSSDARRAFTLMEEGLSYKRIVALLARKDSASDENALLTDAEFRSAKRRHDELVSEMRTVFEENR